MSVWNVFKDRIAFRHHNCVACRKRVQRYNNFLNYKTFSKEIFKEFFKKIHKQLKNNFLKEKKFFENLKIFLPKNKTKEKLAQKKSYFFPKIQ
jgi:hypothetical protein